MLLLILNWFYHRVYWQENLQGLHQKKRRVLAGAGLSLAAAQVVGLVLLGFSSVYREGFETVLFLQAMTLEAGAVTVLEGVALGLAGVVAVFVLVDRARAQASAQEDARSRRGSSSPGCSSSWSGRPCRRCRRSAGSRVTPIEGLELPYWAGLWLGVFPTWQGLLAQAAAAVFVLGSYFAAEALRKRRREARFAPASAAGESPLVAAEPESGSRPPMRVAEPVGTR